MSNVYPLIESLDLDLDIERKIDIATEGLQNHLKHKLQSIHFQQAFTITKYIVSMRSETNLSDNYRRLVIIVLSGLSKYHNNKPFSQMTKNDILAFLDSFRRPEAADPLHKWIGTYNLYRVLIVRFFRWYYFPDVDHKARGKPSCIQNISQLKRKEKSIYKPSDLWTTDDDLIFLKYCPSKRDRCYHMISRDTSCRPHEILKLRIKDVVFKTAGSHMYAEVLVNGKTGSRHIPMIDSIPYLKDWLEDHPHSGNPNAPLICGFGKSVGRFLSAMSMNYVYRRYQQNYFPKLLGVPTVSPEDKNKIKDLLKKPWTLYIRRHTGLTDKSKILSEHVLRQHARWSDISNMPQRYVHYFGNESSNSILEAYGLKPKAQEIDKLSPKQCPNCNEPNKPDSKFCASAKCRMVLSYDAYTETVEEKQEKENRIETLESQIESLMQSQKEILECLKYPDKI